MTGSGLQYTDLVQGTGEMPKPGDTVVIDWDGYTIGNTCTLPYLHNMCAFNNSWCFKAEG